MRISDWSSDVCSSDLTRRSRVKLPTLRRTIRVASLHDLDVHLRPNKGRAATSGLFYREIYSDVAFGRWQSTSARRAIRSEEHTSELQSLMRISYAVFCLKKKRNKLQHNTLTSTAKHLN